MARIMMTVTPFAGHARPTWFVAAELARRGHDVRVHTGRSWAEAFEEIGARVVPWQAPPDFDERNLAATFPRMQDKKGFRQVLVNLQDLFLGTAPAQAQDLVAEHERESWDLLVGDPMALGARFAAETLRTAPWATLSPIAYWPPGKGIPPTGLGLKPRPGVVGAVRDALLGAGSRAGTAALTRLYQRTRREVGLPPDDETFATMWYSPELVVAAGSPGMDYPRDDIPPHVRFAGDLTDDGRPDDGGPLPDWWDDVAGAEVPVVHVTQGTANVDPRDLILPSIEALANQDVLVVVGQGHRTEPLPGPLPANVRVAPMVPYAQLLPRTDVVITNGGYGGVLAALRHDIPLVVAGGDLDKPEIAARIDWHGAGVDLRTGSPKAADVAAAYRKVRGDGCYREAAARLGAELRAMGGTRAAADHLEGHLR